MNKVPDNASKPPSRPWSMDGSRCTLTTANPRNGVAVFTTLHAPSLDSISLSAERHRALDGGLQKELAFDHIREEYEAYDRLLGKDRAELLAYRRHIKTQQDAIQQEPIRIIGEDIATAEQEKLKRVMSLEDQHAACARLLKSAQDDQAVIETYNPSNDVTIMNSADLPSLDGISLSAELHLDVGLPKVPGFDPIREEYEAYDRLLAKEHAEVSAYRGHKKTKPDESTLPHIHTLQADLDTAQEEKGNPETSRKVQEAAYAPLLKQRQDDQAVIQTSNPSNGFNVRQSSDSPSLDGISVLPGVHQAIHRDLEMHIDFNTLKETYEVYGGPLARQRAELHASGRHIEVQQVEFQQRDIRTSQIDRIPKEDTRSLEMRLHAKQGEYDRLLKLRQDDKAKAQSYKTSRDDVQSQLLEKDRLLADARDDNRKLQQALHSKGITIHDLTNRTVILQDNKQALMRIALPLQLRSFRDYLLGQYGVSSRGHLSTPASRVASDALSHLANLPAYTIERMLRFVQFPAV
jgi:hypothetical protein